MRTLCWPFGRFHSLLRKSQINSCECFALTKRTRNPKCTLVLYLLRRPSIRKDSLFTLHSSNELYSPWRLKVSETVRMFSLRLATFVVHLNYWIVFEHCVTLSSSFSRLILFASRNLCRYALPDLYTLPEKISSFFSAEKASLRCVLPRVPT